MCVDSRSLDYTRLQRLCRCLIFSCRSQPRLRSDTTKSTLVRRLQVQHRTHSQYSKADTRYLKGYPRDLLYRMTRSTMINRMLL